MGRIFVISILLIVSVFASEIRWAKNYDDGLSIAKKQNKPLLFVSASHSCKNCIALDKNTFKDTKVIEFLNRNFISVVAYSDEGDFIPKSLYRPSTPTIWFLLPNNEVMYDPLIGAIVPEDFLEVLSIVKVQFDKYQKEKDIK